MNNILFVCHGNICRSVAGEYIMKYILHNKKKNDIFFVDSAATTYDEIGNGIYPDMKKVLIKNNIPIGNHTAKIIKKEDYNDFDYILCMDNENIIHLNRIIGEDINKKIYKLLYFYDGSNNDIEDPWYTRNFEKVYKQLYDSIICFLKKEYNF